MIFDLTNKFSSEQAVTATAASTNVVDLGVTSRDIGIGEVIPVWVGVDVDFAGLTSLQVSIQTDDAENFSSAVTVVQTGAVLLADLKAGYEFAIQSIPKNVLGRYVRVNYTVVGTGTAGTITAGITAGNQQNG